ncbi:MAG: hypothetical protein RL090_882, partial [Bacteroidota bacterium]
MAKKQSTGNFRKLIVIFWALIALPIVGSSLLV